MVIGARYLPRLSDVLNALGIRVLGLPDNPFGDPRLAGHADLSLAHLGFGRFLLAGYLREKGGELVNNLTMRGAFVQYSGREQRREHPHDAALNACIVGNSVICDPRKTEAALWDQTGRRRIAVRQGYAKCAVCPVDERSIVTADRGIASAAQKHGLNVFPAKPGYIELEGFDTGFLGGAAFKLSKGLMAFTGHLKEHPSRRGIEAFLSERSVEPVYITSGPAFDIGSAVLLWEDGDSTARR